MDRVEDVLLHQRILALAKDPEKRPVYHIRFLEVKPFIGFKQLCLENILSANLHFCYAISNVLIRWLDWFLLLFFYIE
jgi:hypothetical protein